MAHVLLFHSVIGLRPAVLTAAERLRAAGHTVLTPDLFDGVVVVSRGQLTLVVEGRRERISAGEVGLVPRGSRVVYRNDGGGACEYLSVCAPAFRPALAHIEEALPAKRESSVEVAVSHPRGAPFRRTLSAGGREYLAKLGLSACELSISLVGDRAIRRLNRTWRRKDRPTDVLSFPAAPPGS